MKSFVLSNTDMLCIVDDMDYEYIISLCGWSDDGKGYARSSKLFDGERLKLHRVIAQRMGIEINGMHVHHKDENPLHNWRSNLEVKSPSEHVTAHNEVRVWPVGENHGNTKIMDADIIDVIRSVMLVGGTQRDMAMRLGVSVAHIGDIVHGRKRPDLHPHIEAIISDTGWREGNKSNTDEEILSIIENYLASGLSATAYAKASGQISRQHLNNVLTGVRLPHLQGRIRELKNNM